MYQQCMYRSNRNTLPTVTRHTRKRQQARHLSGAPHKKGAGAALLPPHMNIALQNQDHALRRSTFFKQRLAGFRLYLFSMTRQPEPIFQRQTLQRSNTFQCFGYLLSRRGHSRRSGGNTQHESPRRILSA